MSVAMAKNHIHRWRCKSSRGVCVCVCLCVCVWDPLSPLGVCSSDTGVVHLLTLPITCFPVVFRLLSHGHTHTHTRAHTHLSADWPLIYLLKPKTWLQTLSCQTHELLSQVTGRNWNCLSRCGINTKSASPDYRPNNQVLETRDES